MSDIYDYIDDRDFPDPQPPEKQRPSNPEGDVEPETVDFFQDHPLEVEFGDISGRLSVYDPNHLDRRLRDTIEAEVIALTAPPIKYYKLRHAQNMVDDLYGESLRRDAYDYPVTIYGTYESPDMEQELTQWGLQEIEEIEINFNYNMLLNTIGDKLQIGDVLQTYDGKLYEVMTSVIVDEEMWRAQHNRVRCKRITTEGIYLPDKPDITMAQ